MIFHQCHAQEMISVGRTDPLPGHKKKCRCRQQVSLEEANRLLDEGRAKRVVTKRWYEAVDIICPLCKGSGEIKNCSRCFGKGLERANAVREEYGDGIVAVAMASVDKSKQYRTAQSTKTPRVATVERAHIERAFLFGGVKEERERIEAYGQMILEAQAALIVGYEPADDPKTGTGRNFDYGRAIII